jgi:hypothetical protein
MSLIMVAYSYLEAKSHGVTEMYREEGKKSAICECDAELCCRFAPRSS